MGDATKAWFGAMKQLRVAADVQERGRARTVLQGAFHELLHAYKDNAKCEWDDDDREADKAFDKFFD